MNVRILMRIRYILTLAVALSAQLPRGNAQNGQDLFQQSMLGAHNEVRRQHGVPELSWSPQLASFAKHWADRLVAGGFLFHRPANDYGENLFRIEGRFAEPDEVVRDWVSESADYDERLGSCRSVCGHYTQIVWSDTRKVGCAISTAGTRQIWVCNYDPPGNIVGRRPFTPDWGN